KQHEIRPQEWVLARDWLLYLDDQFGAPGVGRGGHNFGPDSAVLFIGEAAAVPGAFLHKHCVALFHQLLHASARHRHAIFIILNLFRHTDNHGILLDGILWEPLLYLILPASL